MMQDVQQVKALLARFGLSPNRGLGQNFLVDGDKAEAIAAAACPEGGPVLEIGPGLGALTEPLLARARRVCAVEIDPALCQALQALFGQEPRFTLLQGDFLKADWEEIQAILGGPFSVAANLPYYVTTPICLRLLSCGLPIPRMALMAQAECADRFFAQPGSRLRGPVLCPARLPAIRPLGRAGPILLPAPGAVLPFPGGLLPPAGGRFPGGGAGKPKPPLPPPVCRVFAAGLRHAPQNPAQ